MSALDSYPNIPYTTSNFSTTIYRKIGSIASFEVYMPKAEAIISLNEFFVALFFIRKNIHIA